MALRDIDGEKINQAAESVGELADRVWNLVALVEERGIALESTIFGMKFSMTIRLGSESHTPTEGPKS